MNDKSMRRKAPPPRKPAVGLAPAATAAGPATGIGHELARFPSLQIEHPLEAVFKDAVAQATRGKGNARHGQGRDSRDPANFMAQDWNAIARRHGAGFLSGQAEKKLREALELPPAERRTELLGVLVYVAMLVLHHDKATAS